MGSLFIDKDGNPLYSRTIGFGRSDGGVKKRLTETRRFTIASITKSYTTVIDLQLVEEGIAMLCIAIGFVVSASLPTIAQSFPSQVGPDFVLQTVERVSDQVGENYFDPILAGQAAESLRRKLADGGYDDVSTLKSLSDRLTDELFALTGDKHLVVAVRTTTESDSVESDDSARKRRGQSENFGIQRVEVLDGNVGYLNLTSFYRPEEARDTIATAMHFLRHAEALIVDLRAHSGGSPETTVLFASYFFDDAALPLFRIVDRAGSVRAYATSSDFLADRNQLRPIYLLTSERTFSAGEGIAFLLQEQGRGQVVGDKTAGAANPGRPYDVNPYVEITIPNGKIVSAIRGSNWEGSGVAPDIAVPANDALSTAHARALSDLNRESSSQCSEICSSEDVKRPVQQAH